MIFKSVTWQFELLRFVFRLIIYTKIVFFRKTITTLCFSQQFSENKYVARLKNIKLITETRLSDNYHCWLKLWLSLDSHFTFDVLALLHKDLRNLLENVIIVPYKEMFLKCGYWSSELNNVRIKPSNNFDLYQFAHSFTL